MVNFCNFTKLMYQYNSRYSHNALSIFDNVSQIASFKVYIIHNVEITLVKILLNINVACTSRRFMLSEKIEDINNCMYSYFLLIFISVEFYNGHYSNKLIIQ